MDCINNLLEQLEEFAVQWHVPVISRAGGRLLTEAVRKWQPQSILEIGTAIGYSTLRMAAEMPVGARIVSIELDRERVDIAKDFVAKAGMLEQIEILCGDAGEILPRLTGPFDMVFIDAAKGQYLDYLHKVMGKLSQGAVVMADNVLFRGLVTSGDEPPRRYRTLVRRLRQYLEFVTNDPRFSTTVHHDGDGLSISIFQGSEELC